VRATGERTLFSIKTKSGALHVHHHADGCIHRLKTYSKRNRKRNQKRSFSRIVFDEITNAVLICFATGVQIPHLSAFKTEKEVLLRPGMSAVSNLKHFDLFYQDRLWTAASSALTQLHFCTGQVFASASQVRSI